MSYINITIGNGMREAVVILKKWGSSTGAIFPKEELEKEGLKAGQKAVIRFSKPSSPLKEMFGTMKFSRTTEEMLKELDKEGWDE